MVSPKAIVGRLTRITSSGRYVKEIDSLRFIAITLVVLVHVAIYVGIKYQARFPSDPMQSPLVAFFETFGNGVQLFFTISGFVLGLPFATAYLRGGKPVSLRKYYWRRVTRLEPPYIIVMTGMALAMIFAKPQALGNIAQHLLASLAYCHGFIYGDKSTINFVAWSLEIEVQFYMLMPVLAGIYAIRKQASRRVVWALLGVACILMQMFLKLQEPIMTRLSLSLAWELQYFLAGLFLADVYVERGFTFGSQSWGWDAVSLVGWPALLCCWQFPLISRFAFPLLTVLLYFAAFRGPVTNRFMRNSWIAAIGGMCYTIYLLHVPAISLFGRMLRWLVIGQSYPLTLVAQLVVIVWPVLLTCTAYFLLIEKPCMNPQWPQLLKARLWDHGVRGLQIGVPSGEVESNYAGK